MKNILDGLATRGHTIRVLTNAPERKAGSRVENTFYPVIRKLHDRNKARFFPREVLIDLQDTALLEKQINEFRPDVIYIGHLYILSKVLLPFLARQNTPIVYDEGGSGLIDAWNDHGRWFRFTGDYRSRYALLNQIKPLVIRVICKLSRGRINTQWSWPGNMRVHFNSELNRSNALINGVPLSAARVIHSGVDVDKFKFNPRTGLAAPLKMIVPGRIERRKGQLDAVHLLSKLAEVRIDARLVLAGSKWNDGYFDEVMAEISSANLIEKVTILPMLSTDELIKLYQQADICFFPSHFRTGFSRVPLEAMACGCILITYGNEGSDEVIWDGETGFIFPSEDLQEVVKLIQGLLQAPEKVAGVERAARQEIEEKFSLTTYVDQIEDSIRQAAGPTESYG